LNETRLDWFDHRDNAEELGCVFASIVSREEQIEAEELIFSIFQDSGRDFVWFGAFRTGGTVGPGILASSTWSWVDGSPDFGGGRNAPNLAYQNWTAPEPNGLPVGSGDYAGLFTSSVSPRAQSWGWADMNENRIWPGLYKCCP